MANEKIGERIEKGGRVLDKGFEEGITNSAQDSIDQAQRYAYRKNDEFGVMVNEHPKSFVLGAFLGGVVLGALIFRGTK